MTSSLWKKKTVIQTLNPQPWIKTLKKSIMVTVFMGQRIREHFLPFTDFECILEVTLSEPGWLVFLIFTWCMMTKRDNLGIDSMIYSELKSVRHAYHHCRLATPVCTFFITFAFSPLTRHHLQLLLCLCLSQSNVLSKGQKPISPGIIFHSHILYLQGGFSAQDLSYL